MSEVFVLSSGPLQVNSLVVKIDEKNAFVVDPAACSISADSGLITEFLHSKGLNCLAVVLTHTHFDHICGIREIKDAYPDCKIAVHKLEADEINGEAGKMNRSILFSFCMPQLLSVVSCQPKAEILLEDSMDLSILIQESQEELKKLLSQWKVIHTPGHSPGSICIYNETERIMISGDTLFRNTYGRTDMYGGSESEIMESLDLLDKIMPAGTKVFPGHDSIFTAD